MSRGTSDHHSAMSSDEILLRKILYDLVEAGFDVGIFGGWAEELQEIVAPRRHDDVDILVVNPNLDELDAFVTSRDEVVAKHYPHKRAYIESGVVVELFLVTHRDGRWTTNFRGVHEHCWPTISWDYHRGFPVGPAAALTSYRNSYAEIHGNRNRP